MAAQGILFACEAEAISLGKERVGSIGSSTTMAAMDELVELPQVGALLVRHRASDGFFDLKSFSAWVTRFRFSSP